MKHTFTALLLSAAASLGAQAATYQTIVPAKSQIGFAYKQMGVTAQGSFKKFNAQLQLDTAKPAAAKGQIEIDVASIDTGLPEANQEVLGKDWFNAATHPKASFLLKGLKATGKDQDEASGQLSIKGRVRELVLPVTLSPQGLLRGSFVLKRGDYAIGEGMWSKFDIVANDITVTFSLTLQ